MTDMTGKHLTMGFWSADSLLLSAAKYLKEPEDIVRLATGFGGGMGQKNLCGFLTGGFMAIGMFAGPTKGSDKESRKKCQQFCKEYFEWWSQNYKLTCEEIGSPCNYKEMGNKSSEFLQKLFERETKT
jgi:C_GCAxxG_C_C family probable redox protein